MKTTYTKYLTDSNHAEVSTRRQRTNDVFVGLNTVFLTALGFLLVQSHLDTWWVFAVVSAITLVITLINLTWRASLVRYNRTLYFRYDYLREIEEEFRIRRADEANQRKIGLFLKLKETELQGTGNTLLELRLATYFICLYPVIALVVGILGHWIVSNLIPPLIVLNKHIPNQQSRGESFLPAYCNADNKQRK